MIEFGYGKSPPRLSGTAVSFADCHYSLVGNNDIKINGNGQDSGFSESDEIANRFQPKKKDSILLAESYKRIGLLSKSRRVFDCGSFLSFRHEIFEDGTVSQKGQLYNANFCRDRLCPMCAWRRGLKIFGQASQCVDILQKNYKFLLLTLTVPNCSPDDLSDCIDNLFESWRRLYRTKRFKGSVHGYFRVLEVTRNSSTGFYHPHFHVILAVSGSYNHLSNAYIPHSEWLAMWQRSCNDYRINQVNIKFCRAAANGDFSKSIAEVAKYTVKSSDFIFDNPIVTDSIVSDLSALNGHRLAQFGGVFRTVFHDLKFDDSENGDLIHVSENLNPLISYLICKYGWSAGTYKLSRADFVLGGV